jgi:hypothetical protein
MKTLELTRWSCMVFRELPMLRKSCWQSWSKWTTSAVEETVSSDYNL